MSQVTLRRAQNLPAMQQRDVDRSWESGQARGRKEASQKRPEGRGQSSIVGEPRSGQTKPGSWHVARFSRLHPSAHLLLRAPPSPVWGEGGRCLRRCATIRRRSACSMTSVLPCSGSIWRVFRNSYFHGRKPGESQAYDGTASSQIFPCRKRN